MKRLSHLLFVLFFAAPSSAVGQDIGLRLVWELGGLDGPSEVMWESISYASIISESIYVIDAHAPSVRKFGLDGGFETELGRTGEGPGEFFRPMFATSFGDSVGVYDSSLRRWAFFTSGGQHIETSVPPHPPGRYTGFLMRFPVRKGWHLGLTGWVNDENVEYPHALIQWADNGGVDTVAVISTGNLMYSDRGRSRIHSHPLSVGRGGGFDLLNDTTAVLVDGHAAVARFFSRTMDGFREAERRDLPGIPVSLESNQKAHILDWFFEVTGGDRRQREVFVPDTLPAFTAAHCADGSTVWIRRGGSGRLFPAGETWLRWDLGNNEFLEVEFPPGIETLDIKGSLVLAVRLGEFDELYLQLYRIQVPGTHAP